MDVSIILPSFNEQDVIEETLSKVAAYIDDNEWLGECEVVVVAAGSDRTAEIAASMRKRFKHLEIVVPPQALGKGSDVRAGFLHATGAVRVFTDADLSTPLHHIKRMVELLRDGIDVVIGERKVAKIHPSAIRRLLSQAGPLASRIILGLPWKDTQCGFKGFRAEAASTLFGDLSTNGWGFDLEMLLRAKEAKMAVRSIPINDWHEGRDEGFRGQSVLRVARRTLGDLLSIRVASYGRFAARHTTSIFLLASIAAGAIAACKNLAQSIWFDEAFTTGIINRPVPQLIQGTAHDVHPPLYYLVLKLWASAFGHSIVTLRVFSVLCGMTAIYLGLRLVKRLFGARAAVWAVPFVVFAPFLLRYDIEARMYAMASLIGVAATYVLVIAMERYQARIRSGWLWIAYAVLVAAGVYTLYYTALIWIAHFLWCLIVFRKGRPPKWRKVIREPWLIAFAGGVILYLPWLPTFLGQAHKIQNGFWISKPTLDTVVSIFTSAISYKVNWQLDTWASFWVMLAGVIAGYFVVQAWRAVKAPQRTYLLLFALYMLAPVAVLFVASLPPLQPVFVERYVSQTIVSGYLLLGISVAFVCKARPTIWHFGASILLLCTLVQGTVTLQDVGNYNFETVNRPHAKQVMDYIYSQDPARGTVVTQNSEAYLEMHYYAPDAAWLRPTVTNVVTLALGPITQPKTPLTTNIVWYIYGNNGPEGDQMPGAPYKVVKVVNIMGTNIGTYER